MTNRIRCGFDRRKLPTTAEVNTILPFVHRSAQRVAEESAFYRIHRHQAGAGIFKGSFIKPSEVLYA
jgi:hypothetical protein